MIKRNEKQYIDTWAKKIKWVYMPKTQTAIFLKITMFGKYLEICAMA